MRKELVAAAAAAAAVSLSGCVTPYQDMGFRGGVQAVRITKDTAQIRAQGNAYTDPDMIERYALRRAAEETLGDGFALFRIDRSADRSSTGSESFGSATNTRYGAFASAFTMPVLRPGQSLMIRMLKGPKPDPMPDGEYDAHEILTYLGDGAEATDHRDCTTVDRKVVCK